MADSKAPATQPTQRERFGFDADERIKVEVDTEATHAIIITYDPQHGDTVVIHLTARSAVDLQRKLSVGLLDWLSVTTQELMDSFRPKR